MKVFREILGLAIFLPGTVFVFLMFSESSFWKHLLLATVCFVSAYYIWPSKKRGQRNDDSGWLDIIELMVELPIEIMKALFKLISRFFGRGDGGLDIDV